MYKVVLLRHGESVWNKENRLPVGLMSIFRIRGSVRQPNPVSFLKRKVLNLISHLRPSSSGRFARFGYLLARWTGCGYRWNVRGG